MIYLNLIMEFHYKNNIKELIVQILKTKNHIIQISEVRL